MSVTALHLYEQLTEAPDDKTRAKIIAEAYGQLEDRFPLLKGLATQSHLRETELRLQKEIEQVRLEVKKVEGEIKETELRLQNEIKETELRLQNEIKETELRLQKEIEQTRLEIKAAEVRLTQAIHRQTVWMIGSIAAVIGGIRLLEWFLAHLPPM